MTDEQIRAFLTARIEEDEHLDDYHEKQPTIRHLQQLSGAELRKEASWYAQWYSGHPDWRDIAEIVNAVLEADDRATVAPDRPVVRWDEPTADPVGDIKGWAENARDTWGTTGREPRTDPA